jgi:predicted nucleotidyltransferase
MKLATPTISVPPPFILENPVAEMIQGLLLNEKSADIVFEVVGEDKPKDNAMKMANTAPITFSAHRLIVTNCSSILAEIMCESNGDDRTKTIQITGVTPDVFYIELHVW